MRAIAIFIFALAFAASAAGPFGWFRRKDRAEDTTAAKESLSAPVKVTPTYMDTLNRGKEIALTDKDLVVVVSAQPALAVEKTATPASKETSGAARVIDGFRVQCFATSEIERARAQKTALERKLKYPVYVIFENPFYKIQIGDFAKRSDAEAILPLLRAEGYVDSWIASCKITEGK